MRSSLTVSILRFPAALLLLSALGLASVQAQDAAAPSERVETTTYGGWTVSCAEILRAHAKKTCSAVFRATTKDGQVALIWLIGLDKTGKLANVLRIPTAIGVKDSKTGAVTTGLLVSKGADLKLSRATHHFTYSTCAPQFCEAYAPLTEAFGQDAAATPNAALTVYLASGAAITYNSLGIGGIDKVFASLRR